MWVTSLRCRRLSLARYVLRGFHDNDLNPATPCDSDAACGPGHYSDEALPAVSSVSLVSLIWMETLLPVRGVLGWYVLGDRLDIVSGLSCGYNR